MRILLTGSTGFIGKKLGIQLALQGYKPIVLMRSPERAIADLPFPCEPYYWDPLKEDRNHILKDLIKDCDAVIHLAGESIAKGRWSEKRKGQLVDSRTKTTRSLLNLVQSLPGRKPKVFISAAAVGFYGDRGDEVLDEKSSVGSGFLADLCKSWEREIFSYHLSETRVISLRFGVVLGRDGGALAELIPLFKRGGASALGDGKQWLSWIHYKDLLNLVDFCLKNPVEGVVNAVAPEPVSNKNFTKNLAKRLGVREMPAVPKFVLRFVLGEMAAMLLSSQRVMPSAALALGFKFKYENLDSALHDLCYEVEIARGTYTQELVFEQFVPLSVSELWPFFTDAHNLERLTPPFLNFQVLDQSTPKIIEGTEFQYKLSFRGLPIYWRSRILDWQPGERFVDMQIRGPYSLWHHTHSFQAMQKGTLIRDRVLYRLRFGFLAHLVVGRFVARDVSSIFAFRHGVIRKLFC